MADRHSVQRHLDLAHLRGAQVNILDDQRLTERVAHGRLDGLHGASLGFVFIDRVTLVTRACKRDYSPAVRDDLRSSRARYGQDAGPDRWGLKKTVNGWWAFLLRPRVANLRSCCVDIREESPDHRRSGYRTSARWHSFYPS